MKKFFFKIRKGGNKWSFRLSNAIKINIKNSQLIYFKFDGYDQMTKKLNRKKKAKSEYDYNVIIIWYSILAFINTSTNNEYNRDAYLLKRKKNKIKKEKKKMRKEEK